MVGRQVGQRLRQHDRRRRDRHRPHRARRSLPARPVLPARLCRRRPRRTARARPPSDRRGPARARARSTDRMDAALKGHPYREVGDRHGLLGHAGTGDRACRCASCWADGSASGCSSIGRSRRSRPEKMAEQGRRLSGRRLYAGSSSRSAAIPTPTSPAFATSRAALQPTDRLVADANTGWTQHEALRVVRAVERRRRLHRAAVPRLRGVPGGAAAAPIIRSSWTRPIDGVDVLLRANADRAMDVVNLKISKLGGLTPDEAGPRSLRRRWASP